MSKRVDHPIILGIVGDSASGKSTLSVGVAQILGEEHCTVICTDDYHRYDRKSARGAGPVGARPARQLCRRPGAAFAAACADGEAVLKPVYDHRQGTFEPPEYVKPKEFVIAEGLLGYATRGMRDCYDVKIYLDPEEELRVKWKMHRDTTKRGYTREQVLAQLARREIDSPNFIHPQRTFADIVIRFQRPRGRQWLRHAASTCAISCARRCPIPTLPRLFDGSSNAGMHLELARDRDGKPVDVLEINGNISDKRAERIEDLLWNLIPEAGHLRDQVGRIDMANGAKSHPLALTQLLVGYHAVKAAMGVRAY